MATIPSFLNQVFKGTFLTKSEKAEWSEEMATHLHSSVEAFQMQGYSEEEAAERAITQFGSAAAIRSQVTQETYGYTHKMIMTSTLVCVALFLITLLGGLIANQYGIHNRYIELLPVIWITLAALSMCLVLTRKRVDRLGLITVPFLFVLGYLQAYFPSLMQLGREGYTFVLFENLFFSGAYDTSDRTSHMIVGSLFLLVQSMILYVVSKNRYISILPWAFSLLYSVTHMLIFKLYYALFFSDQFSSAVTRGYGVFLQGNVQRLADMGIKLLVGILLFIALGMIHKRWSKRKVRYTQT